MPWRFLLIVGLICLLCLYPLLAPPAHRIDQAHADLITKDMSYEQAEAIFGVPPGQYDWAESGDVLHALIFIVRETQTYTTDRKVADIDERQAKTWASRHGSFTVWFNSYGQVTLRMIRTDVTIVPPWERWWSRFWNK